MAACGGCGGLNAGDARFCAQCGAVLWETCPACGTGGATGEAFCTTCRTDLAADRRRRREGHEAALAEARRLGDRHDYELAQAKLLPLLQLADPRHADLQRQATALQQHLAAAHEQGRTAAEEARQTALKHIQRGAMEQALGVLTSVPAPLRSEEFRRTLAEVQSSWEETQQLREQVKAAVQANDLAALTKRIDRLLTLRPDDAETRRLAARLRAQLVQKAERELARHEYAQAVRLLAHVSRPERDADFERLKTRADELDWLLTDLQTAPVVDDVLVAVAERLVKLSPQHAAARGLLERVERRRDSLPHDPRHAAPSWVAPEQPALGFPVHWLAGLQRIRCAPRLDARLREEPGRFFVACGLALQGLNRAALPLNLAAPTKETGFFRLPFGRKRPAAQAWGLDFGGSSLKAARLTWNDQEQAVVLDDLELVRYGRLVDEDDSPEVRRAIFQTALTAFRERHPVEGCRLGAALSGSRVLGRTFDLPPVEAKRLADTLQHEAQHQIPLPLDQLVWQYHLLRRPAGTGDAARERGWRVTVEAVRRFHLEELRQTFRDAALSVDVVQGDCAALYNFFLYEFAEFFGADEDAGTAVPPTVAVLDVGTSTTNVLVCGRDVFWHRGLALGGESFTEALTRPLKLTRDQAEQLKRKPTAARRVSRVYELLEPTLAWLLDEVQRTLEMQGRHFRHAPVRQMFGIGGGFALHGLLRRLVVGR